MRLPLTIKHGVASTYRPASQERAEIVFDLAHAKP
jgi:hypothetical protein